MHRKFESVQSLGRGLTLLVGSFTTDGAGAVASQVDPGDAFQVAKPAGTGVYRITLGSVAAPDCVPQTFYTAWAFVEKSTASAYKVQTKAATLATAATPYLEIMTTTRSNAASTISAGVACAVADPTSAAPAVTTGTEYATGLLAGGIYPHNSAAAAGIVTADATDLATSKTLAKAIADYFAAHDDNAVMHNAADAGQLTCAAYASSPAEPADLAEVNAMVLEMSADWNVHAAKVPAIHDGLDLWAPGLLIPNPGAADQPANNRALNALKYSVNMSCLSGAVPSTAYVKTVAAPVLTQGAVTQPTYTMAAPAETEAAADLLSSTIVFGIIVSNSDTNATTG